MKKVCKISRTNTSVTRTQILNYFLHKKITFFSNSYIQKKQFFNSVIFNNIITILYQKSVENKPE